MTRGGGLGGIVLGIMAAVAALLIFGSVGGEPIAPGAPEPPAPIMRYTVPNYGEVIVPPDTHAEAKHGAEIVALIRADVIAGNGNRHDCKDGRTRITGFIHYAGKIVWYLHVSEWGPFYNAYVERTVFNTTQEYIANVLDECGDKNGGGHAFERGSGGGLQGAY